jgi:para-nitrobenzyl esterase
LTPKTAEHLRDVPVEAILATHAAAWNAPGRRPLGIPFAPVIDDDLVRRHPLESLAAGSAPDVDVIIGTTVDEMRPYLIIEPDLLSLDDTGLRRRCAGIVSGLATDAAEHVIETYRRARRERGASTTACDLWLAIQADRFVRYGSIKAAELQSRHGAAAYAYLFAWESPFMNGMLGSFHELDLQFLFGSLDDPITTALTGDRPQRESFAKQLQSTWTAFARNGVPAASWPRYDHETRATMVLDVECSRRDAPFDDERRVWEEILALGDC